jgi:DNA-binding NtrC family response regulator
MSRLIIIDDEESIRLAMVAALGAQYQVDDAAKGEEALEKLRHESYDLVLTDLRMGKVGGMEVLKAAKERNPRCAVMIVTAFASLESAAEAMKSGADDYLAKPFSLVELEHRVAALLDRNRLLEERDRMRRQRRSANCYLWAGPALAGAKRQALQLASSPGHILIQAEVGSCEEDLAWAIHDTSPRREGPFVALDCGLLEPSAMESELFGHERGAYEGATALRKGGLELADGGTLFLGHIGELAPALQGRLQKALEQKGFERVGGSSLLKSDFRLVCGTHKDLKAMAQDGRFRDDLYFRIATLSLQVGPLRESTAELLPLAERMLATAWAGRKLRLGEDAEALLSGYAWPGNLQEMKEVVARAALLSAGELLRLDLALQPAQAPQVPRPGKNLADMMDEAEKTLVEEALRRSGHNQSQAAKMLGIERSTLQYKVKKFKLG